LKKVFLGLIMVCISTLLLAANLQLTATVLDTTYLNNQTKILGYNLTANLPNQIIESVTSPNLNKGEVYTYDFKKMKKTTYYPMLDQSVVSNIDAPYIKNVFDAILLGKVSSSIQLVRGSDSNISKIVIPEQNAFILLSGYSKIGSYAVPNSIVIYQENSVIEKIDLSNIKIN